MVILWDPHRSGHPAPSKTDVEQLIFGDTFSVKDYFLENSGGLFTIACAGVLGWYDADKPGDHYWGPPDREDLPEDRNGNGALDPGEDLNHNGRMDGPDGLLQPDEDRNSNGKLDTDLDQDGWITGHTEKWAEAIRKGDVHFDFKEHDSNEDGRLTPDELAVLIVIPQNSPFGTMRTVVGRQHPVQEPLTVDGVEIGIMVEAYIGSPPSLGTVAHELAHILFGAADLYFNRYYPYAAGFFSLMAYSPHHPSHLDPFHKLKLGWVKARVVDSEGWQELNAVETHHEVLILHDPARGDKEYYIIENRWPGDSYDRYLPDAGLAVWHVIEAPEVFGSLPAPRGVSAEWWSTVSPLDWGRRALRMIKPVYGPPLDWSRALWKGAVPVTRPDADPTAQNGTSSKKSSGHRITLPWADGESCGYSLRNISEAGKKMRFEVVIE